jgi:hypothetical protein
MTAMGDSADDWRDDAAALLSEAMSWRLTEARWALVSQIISRLEAAAAVGQNATIDRAIIDLESVGPSRAIPVGSAASIPAPEPIRERCAELIHELRAPSAAGARDEAENPDHPRLDEQTGAAHRL